VHYILPFNDRKESVVLGTFFFRMLVSAVNFG